MDSLTRRKIRQTAVLVGVAAALIGLVLFHGLRPSPEEQQAAALRDILVAGDGRFMDEEERQHLREQWQRLNPDTRRNIVTEVCRARIEQMREEQAHLSVAERRERIQQAVAELRRNRRNLSEAEKEQVKGRLALPETQDMVRHILNLYHTEFTPRESAEMDPLLHEWISQMEGALR